jgi:hypothetical protein
MKRQFQSFRSLFIASAVMFGAMSCSDDENSSEVIPQVLKPFHVAIALGSEDASQTYVQGLTDLSTGTISFDNFGFQLPSTRTARFYASNDSKYIYNLDYGGGTITKFEYTNGQTYKKLAETDVQHVMGTANPRWTKVDDTYALLHNVTTKATYGSGGEYTGHDATAVLASVKLEDVSIAFAENFVIPIPAEARLAGYYPFRIDAPVVKGNKAYYGMGFRKFDVATGANYSTFEYEEAMTLVVDYPQLTNPTIIATNKAKGATNGYRTPVAHLDEKGDIYQLLTVNNNQTDTYIMRIKDGKYDESYAFNLSQLVGESTMSNGWFYAGNGIGYVPYVKSTLGGLGTANWGLARVDLNNNSVVKLSLPADLWLQQYQWGAVRDGKFYMAVSPTGGEGNIYIFDVNSTSAMGYTKGATIKTGADAYYIGVF